MHIASVLGENVREIEGIITKINAYARMTGQEVSLDFAKGVLKDSIRETKANITLDRIIEVVSHELNVKIDDIRSKSKITQIVNARRIVIYLARDLTPNSMPIIANFFGMKDHSAISHSVKKLQDSLNKDATFSAKIEELKSKIKQM
jgi:chromosomal replication initiator protein